MTVPLRDEVREWLRKALYDLGSARKLVSQPEPYRDTAIYHCQQAAEKAIKAFLAFREIRFERTHDIEVLTSLAARTETGFGDWTTAGQLLTPYAAIYRYPGDMDEPDQSVFIRGSSLPRSFLAPSPSPLTAHPSSRTPSPAPKYFISG